ncbi:MAG: 3-deoxy-D-manno-octulosonic acid kinase [Granulosicoccus sp.]
MTQKLPDAAGTVVRYVQNPTKLFDPVCLETNALHEQRLIKGEASAGRGNTVFFTLHNELLVLRHYRRGGLVRYISKKHYLYVGLHRTRAMREFDLLLFLQQAGLPAPLPYACSVVRCGLLYTASLVTHHLPGRTLAERLLADACLSADITLDEGVWRSMGYLIARFHVAGVFHADLNAHNIMLDDDGNATLIDFDRGRIRQLPKNLTQEGWCLDNMDRLERSLVKIAESGTAERLNAHSLVKKFAICRKQWSTSLNTLMGV